MVDIESEYDELRIKYDMQGAYFYPLSKTSYKNVLVYDEDRFNGDDDSYENLAKLIEILKNIGVKNIMCNSIYDGIYETELSELWLGVGDVYYFDSTLEWVIYASHEGTISFAGDELVEKVASTFGDSYIATDWV